MRGPRFPTERGRRRREEVITDGGGEMRNEDDKQIYKVPLCAFALVLNLPVFYVFVTSVRLQTHIWVL